MTTALCTGSAEQESRGVGYPVALSLPSPITTSQQDSRGPSRRTKGQGQLGDSTLLDFQNAGWQTPIATEGGGSPGKLSSCCHTLALSSDGPGDMAPVLPASAQEDYLTRTPTLGLSPLGCGKARVSVSGARAGSR